MSQWRTRKLLAPRRWYLNFISTSSQVADLCRAGAVTLENVNIYIDDATRPRLLIIHRRQHGKQISRKVSHSSHNSTYSTKFTQLTHMNFISPSLYNSATHPQPLRSTFGTLPDPPDTALVIAAASLIVSFLKSITLCTRSLNILLCSPPSAIPSST